jgi:hypothetical protein
MTPVFMIGTQRSGSNLLRLMINQLHQIASPHPPHIMERIHPLLDHYGDLGDDAKFRQLVEDVCRLVELNPVKWEMPPLDREDVYSRCREPNLIAVHSAIYDMYAESQKAKTWCCKSLANIQYTDEIEDYLKTPKYIYLYRDGRDVALSFQKAVVGEKHIYNIAEEWRQTQELAIDLKNKIDPARFFSISYEELTGNAEESARALCKFLEVDYTDEMLSFHKTSEAKRAAESSQLWGNVTSPVMKDNTKKYQKEMSVADIKIFESVAGHVLDELGYSRDYVEKGNEYIYSQSEIEKFNEENKRLKLASLLNVDKEDLERRKRQTSLLEEIKSRSAA